MQLICGKEPARNNLVSWFSNFVSWQGATNAHSLSSVIEERRRQGAKGQTKGVSYFLPAPKDLFTLSIISVALAGFMLFFPKTSPASRCVIHSLRVPLNQAQPHQLQCLSGIGWQRATAIYAYRRRYGPFTDYQQLRRIPGIGPWLIKKIKAETVLDDRFIPAWVSARSAMPPEYSSYYQRIFGSPRD